MLGPLRGSETHNMWFQTVVSLKCTVGQVPLPHVDLSGPLLQNSSLQLSVTPCFSYSMCASNGKVYANTALRKASSYKAVRLSKTGRQHALLELQDFVKTLDFVKAGFTMFHS